MSTVAILHPGAMGAAIGAALVGVGHEVWWLPAGRGDETRQRAAAAGLVEHVSVVGADVVISICPPEFAVATARSVEGFTGCYIDANAISPASAAQVASVVQRFGATYVDGGVIGGPPTVAGTTRLYLSGGRAGEMADLFASSPLEALVVEPGDYAASALKMSYAAWTKGSTALLLAVRATARELGVEAALLQEWALSQPALATRYAGALSSAQANGWRWAGELREIAATFGTAGQPEGFGAAAAEVFEQYPRPHPR
jgi:3-hydroxyisobutyrate dehydrogenase-like beta-hydroxyacid dehydrogenase